MHDAVEVNTTCNVLGRKRSVPEPLFRLRGLIGSSPTGTGGEWYSKFNAVEELLDASAVAGLGNVDVALGVSRQRVRVRELARACPFGRNRRGLRLSRGLRSKQPLFHCLPHKHT